MTRSAVAPGDVAPRVRTTAISIMAAAYRRDLDRHRSAAGDARLKLVDQMREGGLRPLPRAQRIIIGEGAAQKLRSSGATRDLDRRQGPPSHTLTVDGGIVGI